jgi:hypothetical protein
MKTVYWATFPVQDEFTISELRYSPPESLLKDISPTSFFGQEAGRCPAIINECRNTYKIKSPLDLHITYTFEDNYNSCISKYPQNEAMLQQLLGVVGPEKVVQLAAPTYLFYCDEDLTMSMLPPYYEETDFTAGCMGVSATYNINKWFRPVKPTFKLKKNNNVIDIKMNEAICYYKFNTDEKIKLVQFDATDFHTNGIMKDILTFKFNTKNPAVPTKLIDSYNAFVQARYNKRIMKVIKNNLLD